MIVIDSIYINSGGGLVLLNYFLQNIPNRNNVIVLVDERNESSGSFITNNYKIISSSIYSRYQFYKKNKKNISLVFCFGNIPPPIRLGCRVYTYFHQPLYLVERKYTRQSPTLYFNYLLKKIYLRTVKKNTDYFIVQSALIQSLLSNKFQIDLSTILIYPFFDISDVINYKKETIKSKFIYLYPSDGHFHKNHIHLLHAWKLLNQIYPELQLHLTISNSYPDLKKLISEFIDKGVNIHDHGFIKKDELSILYASSKFVVYPSLAESFGLGLIEAFYWGCEVITSDLPYANEILEPYATFKPNDIDDIVDKLKSSYEIDSDQNRLKTQSKISNRILQLNDLLFT